MSGVIFTVHPTDDPTPPLYAIMPDDDGPGYLVGEIVEVVALRDALDRLVETGQHDGEISHLDERLGWTWLTVPEAADEYGVPRDTVRWAARNGRIGGAKKDGGQWRFPAATFRGWLRRKYQRGRPRTWS
jgi:excisionase family DNA binding protein